MNGDIGKIPSGAVYAASPEPQASTVSVNDYSTLNGVVEPQETFSDVPTPATGGSVPEATATPELPPDPTSAPTTPGLPLDQLKQMLSTQLEYYFSRENLANDAYLLSQMDNDQYVPIWTVANFNQVKKLTKDIKLITEVLKESPNVQVDEEGQKVRPSHKRCIVILREIPDSTPLEEVKGLFSGKGCPKLVSCEFAHNNSWYVTFENDEDAQKAYRFLREEVREFQGKPIMARIKAKPMNRLPIPPVVSAIGGMKNGYRAPPAATATTPAFDPTTAYPPAQQRFLYNGNTIPSVNYGSPVQIYTFPNQQPFYSAGMIPHWGPTSPAYFEFGSVFSVNGLAPQTTFGKAPNSRFVPGSRNNRRRRKEDEVRVSSSPGPIAMTVAATSPRGPQFDLEEDAFPPLPGLEAPASAPPPVPVTSQEPPTEPSQPVNNSQSHRENRLSDVVKGTAKSKPLTNSSVSVKEKESGSPRPRSASPPCTPSQVTPPALAHAPAPAPTPLPLPTPPLTPEKTVPVIAVAKCCTADKSTKTDDMVVNGAEAVSAEPATTNAATMTDVTTPPQPNVECSGSQRLSYAQVAQHAKEKQLAERAEKLSITTSTEDDKKEVNALASGQTSPKETSVGGTVTTGGAALRVGAGRGSARSLPERERGPRRRDKDSLLRFNSRPRSPK